MTPDPAANQALVTALAEIGTRVYVLLSGRAALRRLYPWPNVSGIGSTAIHEAAHTVAALVYAVPFLSVEVFPTPVDISPSYYARGALTLSHSLVFDSDGGTSQPVTDFELIRHHTRIVASVMGPGFARQWLRYIRQDIDGLITTHIQAIRALATELEQRHRLTYQQVIALARQHWAFASVREVSPHHWSVAA